MKGYQGKRKDQVEGSIAGCVIALIALVIIAIIWLLFIL